MDRYKKDFYQGHGEGSKQSAQEIVPLVMDLIKPKSVLDVGCGTGTWLSVFKDKNVNDIWGVDGEWIDTDMLQIPKERFFTINLEKPFNLDKQFDLVVSMEVAEHLPKESAESYVKSLTNHGPVILFSAAIPFQGGTRHLNEQWPDYWVKHFSNMDYIVLDPLRKKIWSNKNVDFWYAQNVLLFVKREYLENHPNLIKEVKNIQRSQLSIVHPKQHMVTVARNNPKNLKLSEVLRAIPILVKDKLKHRKRGMV
jgi:SAM-dependent methyltransferase